MNTDFHRRWWFRSGLNRKPSPYEGDALTNWATEPYGGRCRIRTALQDPKTRVLPLHHILHIGAGDGNRTRVSTLEGWRSTIELHRRRPNQNCTGAAIADGVLRVAVITLKGGST